MTGEQVQLRSGRPRSGERRRTVIVEALPRIERPALFAGSGHGIFSGDPVAKPVRWPYRVAGNQGQESQCRSFGIAFNQGRSFVAVVIINRALRGADLGPQKPFGWARHSPSTPAPITCLAAKERFSPRRGKINGIVTGSRSVRPNHGALEYYKHMRTTTQSGKTRGDTPSD